MRVLKGCARRHTKTFISLLREDNCSSYYTHYNAILSKYRGKKTVIIKKKLNIMSIMFIIRFEFSWREIWWLKFLVIERFSPMRSIRKCFASPGRCAIVSSMLDFRLYYFLIHRSMVRRWLVQLGASLVRFEATSTIAELFYYSRHVRPPFSLVFIFRLLFIEL